MIVRTHDTPAWRDPDIFGELDTLDRAGIVAPRLHVDKNGFHLTDFSMWVRKHGRLPKRGEGKRDWFEWSQESMGHVKSRYGRRTVLHVYPDLRHGHRYARTKCDCGTITDADVYCMERGVGLECQPCAARRRQGVPMPPLAKGKRSWSQPEIIRPYQGEQTQLGRVFGARTVVEYVGHMGTVNVAVRVRCKCGTEDIVKLYDLERGKANQCIACARRKALAVVMQRREMRAKGAAA